MVVKREHKKVKKEKKSNSMGRPSSTKKQPCTRISAEVLKDFLETTLTFRPGQRGSRLLEVEGYTYVKNRVTDTKTYWICARKGAEKCQLRAVTQVVDGVERLISKPGVHEHPPANRVKVESPIKV